MNDMAAYKLLKQLKINLKKVEQSQPGNWLGHWAKSLKLRAINNRILDIETDLKNKKNK